VLISYVKLSQLKHIYHSPSGEARPVLNIPEWILSDGQQVLVQGVSGSGKTTLFNILSGLLHPTEGLVFYGDQSLYQFSEAQRDRFRARHIGYVFQNHYLLPELTALENVVMPMAFAGGVPRGEWRKRATEILDKMGMADHLHYRPAKLSTGQRLRVAIARALVNQPNVLLADEPTAALDAEMAQTAMDMVQEICAAHKAILIVASHDPALEKRFDTIVHLANQQISLEARNSA
jgi:putative ABC transport system ATP-binding protein